MKIIPIALALGAAVLASPSAFAGEKAVSYADLDLNTKAGVEELEQRIRRAARAVCNHNPAGQRVMLSKQLATSTCVRNAHIKVRSQVAAIVDRARTRG